MYKLQNWEVYQEDSPYTPPELRRVRLAGEVYGHPRFKDGQRAHVSTVVKVEGRVVTTRNSIYKLGKIHPKYRKYLSDNNIKYNPKQPVALCIK